MNRSAIGKYKRFNRKDPKKIITVDLETQTPLIRIGWVPEIIYISDKEGKKISYRHKTKSPYPVLYAHPTGKYFVMIGGRIKIKDWLYN